MARPLRIEYEGAIYHVTARGNERGKIFFSKTDYERFKEYIAAAKLKFSLILHAYVLMANHYHLIIETPEKNLSKIMHYLNSSYTTYVNVKRKRSGHLFQGRYKAILVDKDNYLLELSRYLHLNPVRANMAQKPEEYFYSSYRSYVTGHSESIVSTDTILGMLAVKKREAPVRYLNFVESAMGEEMPNPLQKVYGGMILGSKRFIRDALARVDFERVETPEVCRGKALRCTFGIEEIISACCEHYGLTREEIMCSRRSESRKACVYLIKRHTCATNREVAELFGTLSYSAVAKISQSVSKQLVVDNELGEQIKRLQAKYSLFKA
jgi:REP element-mobilizing transposase RayT